MRLDLPIQADFVNQALLGVQPDILEIGSGWHDCQLDEANDALGVEIDAGQRHNLVQRACKKREKK